MDETEDDAKRLEALVVRAISGDDEAFGALVVQFQRRVFYAAYRVVKDMHLADDLAQEAFLKAHRALPRLKEPGFFGTWIQRIALNTALDARKKLKRRRAQEVSGGEFTWIEAPADPNLRDVLDDVEGLRDATRAAIGKLPKRQRVVVEMSLDPETTHDEIAKVLAIPRGTVKSRLHHARKFLFERLRPFLGDA